MIESEERLDEVNDLLGMLVWIVEETNRRLIP